ncbi:hypothetical protein N7474_009239 [Penicillium riverlandense]|uniref:uncharacterized protein n=1 Tax=Penicillium riverlandense TaxID=1903569 RepID=UPI002546D76D|nr:uncharacterized protein N7474_009239 [Penicillium riverlandense]KAJ5807970.1 hypothetical protein N7474_009239 [Penicillium riverlandense]
MDGLSSVRILSAFSLDCHCLSLLVTGAGGFLGTTVTESILESGGDVICLDVMDTPKALEWENIEHIAKKYSRFVSYHQCNVQSDNEVAETFTKFVPTLRFPIRGLVACAGISDNGPATEFPGESFSRLLDINVTGTFRIAQAVAREVLRVSVSASMVFVASMSGYGVDTAGYNSSKAAVHQLARSLAAEWGSRVGMPLIRVNSLSPGYIRTAATAEALQKPGMEAQWTGDNMLYRLSTVDEFRAPVIFLLGDGSSFMTGSDLRCGPFEQKGYILTETNLAGQTLLHVAAGLVSERVSPWFKFLQAKGLDSVARDKEGKTPIDIAKLNEEFDGPLTLRD